MIPLIRARGSHAEAGAAVGAATADTIRRAVEQVTECYLEAAAPYRAVTIEHLPWIVEELDAAAEAAEVDAMALFAASIEELRLEDVQAATARGCTDVVAGGVVAHTNDLESESEREIVAIEWRVDGEPTIFTLGAGPWLSVGWNEAGLSVTGNELSPNDERVGIPRLLQMRDVLTRRSLGDAVEAVLHPARASSYNWVLASPEGAIDVEGSATAADVRIGDTLVHTNHYVEPSMSGYERDGDYSSSRLRHARATELLERGARPAEILADHANAPSSICRHGGPDGVKTVFWCVADLGARRIAYGRGNPCDSEQQVYEFA